MQFHQDNYLNKDFNIVFGMSIQKPVVLYRNQFQWKGMIISHMAWIYIPSRSHEFTVRAGLQQLLRKTLRCWIIGKLKCSFLSLTFLKMFIPRSVERSGTAGLRKLVSETLENASVLRDFSSSLHFIVRSCSSQKKTSTRRNRGQSALKKELLPRAVIGALQGKKTSNSLHKKF